MDSAFALSHKAEKIEEEVDEVQIELKRRIDGSFLGQLSIMAESVVIGLDLLGVIGGEAQEDGDADEAVDPFQAGEEGEEKGEQAKEDQEDETTRQDGAQPGEITLCEVTVQSQRPEVEGGDGEDKHQTGQVKDQKIGGKDYAGQRGVRKEQKRGTWY